MSMNTPLRDLTNWYQKMIVGSDVFLNVLFVSFVVCFCWGEGDVGSQTVPWCDGWKVGAFWGSSSLLSTFKDLLLYESEQVRGLGWCLSYMYNICNGNNMISISYIFIHAYMIFILQWYMIFNILTKYTPGLTGQGCLLGHPPRMSTEILSYTLGPGTTNCIGDVVDPRDGTQSFVGCASLVKRWDVFSTWPIYISMYGVFTYMDGWFLW